MHGMYNHDAKSNQEGEAYPCKQPSAVKGLKASDSDYKASAQQVSGLKDAQHAKTYEGPMKGSKAAQTGHNSDFEGMRY